MTRLDYDRQSGAEQECNKTPLPLLEFGGAKIIKFQGWQAVNLIVELQVKFT